MSNTKKGNAYYVTIKAVGQNGDSVGVFAGNKGQNTERLFVITIINPSPHIWDNYIPPDDNYMSVINNPDSDDKTTPPHIEGLYNIIETGFYDATCYTKAGVLTPLITTYDPNRTFDEQANALRNNLSGGCIMPDTTIGKGSEVSYGRGIADFIEQNGKYGLNVHINEWRHNKHENVGNDFLNSMLNSFCFLANDKMTGEALWAWLDAFYINNGHIDTNDYGFVDDKGGNANDWTATYKRSGAKVNIHLSGQRITFLFTPKK